LNKDQLKDILMRIKNGHLDIDEAIEILRSLPFEDIGFACIDHHRGLRKVSSEVIFGQSKEVEDIISIMESMNRQGDNILITRLTNDKASKILERFPGARYYRRSGALILMNRQEEDQGWGTILVLSAGTSDIPVAEEAAVTAQFLGNRVRTIYDVGVAGIHRVIHHKDIMEESSVIIVAAGMEGALPSVVAGMVERPIIALPTSIGYGASFRGLSALLGMLNSCAPGVMVVNIDNGFGAGYAASLINKRDVLK
jgi:hypothetical protein